MLTKDVRDRVEKRLLQERAEAVEAVKEFDAGNQTSLLDATGELSVYRFHLADIGTETIEQEQSFLLASKEGERLYEIDEALRRLYKEPESFGVCQRCGRDIEEERLDVVPATRHCAECQRALEE